MVFRGAAAGNILGHKVLWGRKVRLSALQVSGVCFGHLRLSLQAAGVDLVG